MKIINIKLSKMLAKWYVPLIFFVLIISFLCNASSDINSDFSNIVKIFVALPINSESLHFYCDRGWGNFEMKPGETRERHVSNIGVSCKVTRSRGQLEAVFVARNGEFWIIRFDGFLRSYDHIHWVLYERWFNNTNI
jgi:hypothetical protein